MAGPEGGNATVSFLISLIFAPLPELSFGGSATVTEILAFPLGLKKKKERKKRGPACRGRKKPLCQTTQSSSHAWPVRTYSLFRPMQTHKEPHACQQCNWKSWAMWYLTGTLSEIQGIILMIVPTYNSEHLWGFCYMYSNASAFLLPKRLLTRAYASAASFHSEIIRAVLFLCIRF